MDIIGIKKLVDTIEYYDRREYVEDQLGVWGDPDMWYFLKVEAMAKLLRKCRGNKRLRRKYLEIYSD